MSIRRQVGNVVQIADDEGLVYSGRIVAHGPYRWRWMARLVAWFEDGQH